MFSLLAGWFLNPLHHNTFWHQPCILPLAYCALMSLSWPCQAVLAAERRKIHSNNPLTRRFGRWLPLKLQIAHQTHQNQMIWYNRCTHFSWFTSRCSQISPPIEATPAAPRNEAQGFHRLGVVAAGWWVTAEPPDLATFPVPSLKFVS